MKRAKNRAGCLIVGGSVWLSSSEHDVAREPGVIEVLCGRDECHTYAIIVRHTYQIALLCRSFSIQRSGATVDHVVKF